MPRTYLIFGDIAGNASSLVPPALHAQNPLRTTVAGALVFICLLAVPHAAGRGDEVAALVLLLGFPELEAQVREFKYVGTLRRASRADRRPSAWCRA